ncbi:MAG: recombinase family protein [Terriglobales bacterium]
MIRQEPAATGQRALRVPRIGHQFISLHEGVDASTANGRLVFGIFASIAEFERDLIRERVRSGLQHAKSKGIRLGRPRLPDSSQQSRTTRWRRMRVAWRCTQPVQCIWVESKMVSRSDCPGGWAPGYRSGLPTPRPESSHPRAMRTCDPTYRPEVW